MSQPGNELYQPVVLRGPSIDMVCTVPTVFTLAVREALVEVMCGFSETVEREQKSDIKHVKMVPCYLAVLRSDPLKHTPHKRVHL